MIALKSAVGAIMNSLVYSVNDGKSNVYYLIDIGDYDAAMSILPKDAQVCGVFITHGHHDHIIGLNRLKSSFPDCKVYGSEECARMVSSAKANLSAYIGIPFAYEGEVTILKDGDNVELFEGITLMAFSTIGHNPSCMSFVIENYIFTGDSYIPGTKVVTNLPGGDKRQAQISMKRLIELSQDKILFPGHKVI